MNWPFVSRRRYQATAEKLARTEAALAACRTYLDDARKNVSRLNAAASSCADKHQDAGRVIACLEQRVAAEARRADLLQARLDDALGLNDPAVAAGERWQRSRDDKPNPLYVRGDAGVES